jgi:hypothetical protein
MTVTTLFKKGAVALTVLLSVASIEKSYASPGSVDEREEGSRGGRPVAGHVFTADEEARFIQRQSAFNDLFRDFRDDLVPFARKIGYWPEEIVACLLNEVISPSQKLYLAAPEAIVQAFRARLQEQTVSMTPNDREQIERRLIEYGTFVQENQDIIRSTHAMKRLNDAAAAAGSAVDAPVEMESMISETARLQIQRQEEERAQQAIAFRKEQLLIHARRDYDWNHEPDLNMFDILARALVRGTVDYAHYLQAQTPAVMSRGTGTRFLLLTIFFNENSQPSHQQVVELLAKVIRNYDWQRAGGQLQDRLVRGLISRQIPASAYQEIAGFNQIRAGEKAAKIEALLRRYGL